MRDEEAGRRWRRHSVGQRHAADQGRRRLRQCGDDFRRRQVGHVPHADASGHCDHSCRAGRGRIDRRLRQGLHHSGGRRLRSYGAHGCRVHPDGDVARLPRRSGVRHFRRRDRGGEAACGSMPSKINSAIAQCVNLAAGNLEGARSGGRSLREGGAVRNALLAVAMAKHGTPGGETTLEGEAGFYHAYAGNNLGRLRHSFTGKTPHRHRQRSRRTLAGTGSSSRRCTASIPPPATISRMSM